MACSPQISRPMKTAQLTVLGIGVLVLAATSCSTSKKCEMCAAAPAGHKL